MRSTSRGSLLGSLAVVLSVGLTGCTYRLRPAMLPSVYKVRVVADLPHRYTVRLRVVDGPQYEVPPEWEA